MSSDQTRNREAWLTDLTALLLPLIRKRTGLALTEGSYKLSCGFPSKGGTRSKNRTIGECHHVGSGGERKFHQIFIHPQLVDPVDIGGVVVHELLHAMLPNGVGHRKPFSQAAKKVGLDGKPTATYPSDELIERIREAITQLGPYPHESLNQFGGPKQGTRMVKVMCPLCGYICRTTLKWIDEAGAPICPQCNINMEEAGVGEEAQTPLVAVDQTVEYVVKATNEERRKAKATGLRLVYDNRYRIRMNRKGSAIQWWVMDFGPSIDDRGLAILGPVMPRLTPAESRQDAYALLEALRDGTLSYTDIAINDDDPALDVDDPFYEDEDEETADFDDSILTEEELEEYEAEERKREGWIKEEE